MIPKNLFSFLVLSTFYLLFSSCQQKQHIHMLVHNASIYVVDDSFTISQAMAIQDGKIVETGLNDVLLKKYEADSVLDAGGKAIYPGLIDAHCHFTGYATDKWKCNLVGTKSFSEVVDSLVAYSQHAPAQWLYGRGWDQNDWAVKEFPDKKILDSLFPDRPV
ncbi:MAG: amidohydrolase family protein, partial [Ferruginibacter sp.]